MSRPIEEIEAELRFLTLWSIQADEIEESTSKHANSLRRKRACLIEEMWNAKNQAKKEANNET